MRKGRYVIRIHSAFPNEDVGEVKKGFPPFLTSDGRACLEAHKIDPDLIEARLKLAIVKKCLHVGIAFIPTEDSAQ